MGLSSLFHKGNQIAAKRWSMHEPLSEAFIINIVNAFGAKLVENWNCFMEAESGRAVKCAAPDRLLTTPLGLDYITLGWNEDDSKWYWD